MPSDGDANSGATVSATAPSGSIMASSLIYVQCIFTAETGNTQWKIVERVEAMATSMGCLRRGDQPSK